MTGARTQDRDEVGRAGVRSVDAEAHGESAARTTSRVTPEGEVRTQRGERSDVPPELLAHGHETRDVDPRAVSYALIGFLVAIAVCAALVAGILVLVAGLQERPPAGPLAKQVLTPPSPRLEVAPARDRAALENEALARLDGYGWADRGKDLARIPIERAMQLLAQHGWPDAVAAQERDRAGPRGPASARAGPSEAVRPAGQGGSAPAVPDQRQNGSRPALEARP